MASFLLRCARCSCTSVWVRGSRSSRRCPYRVAVPPEGGGAPPALGGRRAAPVAPQLRWVRGGGGLGGPPPRPLSGLCGRGGGGSGGGPLVPWRCLLSAGGGGAWQSWPRGPAIGRGVAPFPRPPLPRAGFSRRPSLGPLIPRPSRGAGRPGLAVRVSGQWLAGCWAAGSPPRSLPPAPGLPTRAPARPSRALAPSRPPAPSPAVRSAPPRCCALPGPLAGRPAAFGAAAA